MEESTYGALMILVVFGAFLLTGWLLWLIFKRNQLILKTRFQKQDVFNKMIDKFSSSEAFIDFLKTDQAKNIMDFPQPNGVNPLNRVIVLATIGVLLIFIGIGFYINANSLRGETDIHYVYNMKSYYFDAYMAIALGIGSLVASFIAYTLGVKWNLFDKKSDKR
ncbi:MAG: hypothetical protein ACHQQQ_14505 [Bacteroidota bacterium]